MYFYLRRAGQNNVRTDQISLSLHGGTQRSVQTVYYIFLSHFNNFSASESVFVSFSIITLRSLYFRRKASKQITNNQRDYQRRIKKRKQNLLDTFLKKNNDVKRVNVSTSYLFYNVSDFLEQLLLFQKYFIPGLKQINRETWTMSFVTKDYSRSTDKREPYRL